MIQDYLSFSDLVGLDSSPSAVRTKFEQLYGETPDGLALNTETYYDAVTPPITEQYSQYCYKRLGTYRFTQDTSQKPQQAVVGSNTARNESDQEAEISLTVNGSWSDTVGWSSSITEGLTFSAEFELEGAFKMGMGFSISVTAGSSGSHSESKSASASVKVTVPPKSEITVQMVATLKKETLDFEVPIAVSGMFGANFSDPVQGHYFWFRDAATLLPKTSGTIKGRLDGTAAFDVHTIIGSAKPIGS